MGEAVICAIISGALSLAGIIYTSFAAARKSEHAITMAQAITDTKLEELTREVREHNNFGRRIPVIEEQIKVINHRIRDLEEHPR